MSHTSPWRFPPRLRLRTESNEAVSGADGAPAAPARAGANKKAVNTKAPVIRDSISLQFFEQLLGFLQPRVSAFGLAEFARVDPPPHPMVIHRITQVQHLMEHHVFQRQPRRRKIIEDPADDDGIVRGIEVAQYPTRGPAAPA